MPELPLRNSAILLRSLGAAGFAGLQSLYLRSLLQEEPAVPAHRPIPGGRGVVCIAMNTACLDGAGFGQWARVLGWRNTAGGSLRDGPSVRATQRNVEQGSNPVA